METLTDSADVIFETTDKYLIVNFVSDKAKKLAKSDMTISGISYGTEVISMNVLASNEKSIQSYLSSQGLTYKRV